MRRNRVLSLLTGQARSSNPATPDAEPVPKTPHDDIDIDNNPTNPPLDIDAISAQLQQKLGDETPGSPRSPATPSRARADSRASTRPASMVITYIPPFVEVAQDTPPELQPIFSFLNSHSNKLYQEGYFLKLHDLDTRGRPSQDRVWAECFAQLVGTVLSLWDAAALDQAGEDGEVVPTFINLSDASIRMIESLPMNGAHGGNLQNVLSVSTAANNRYLLHFNSLNSLTQWTAGIRLAMFEHSTLQEAYTGSLIAGKGKYLNNIKQIMDRSKFVHEDWARVRFGAGTPWQRCWCVITPPDEKEYQKAQKSLKKSSTYSRAMMPKGHVKFYDTRKVTKKTKPLATITDAYAAYAIYPQSKPLVDQSTLVKLEGLVTMHSKRETTAEGFVFVMPEVHPAVSGFEMMLRWLFPVFDTFALYGRPTRLIADTLDQRGLMFAMPKNRRYGYLDVLDVSTLIHTSGSQSWSERQWRKEMKKLTSTKIMNRMDDSPRNSRQIGQRRNTTSRNSLPATRIGVQFQDQVIRSSPGSRSGSPAPSPATEKIAPPRRTDSAPPQAMHMSPGHKRSVSEAHGYRRYAADNRSRLSQEASRPDDDEPPTPPRHGGPLGNMPGYESMERINSSSQSIMDPAYEEAAQAAISPNLAPPEPVISPPAFQHNPNDRPATLPQAPELRRAHSNVDAATLQQMQDAVRPPDEDIGLAISEPDRSMERHGDAPYHSNGGLIADMQGFLGTENGNGWARDPRQRLSTIPGSPYIGNDADYFHAQQQTDLPPMAEVMNRNDQRPPIEQLHSSHSITRKPVPKQSQGTTEAEHSSGHDQASQVRETMEPPSPDSPPAAGDGLYDFVDDEALERVLNDSQRTSTLASSATPDYASIESGSAKVKQKPKEWQRPGKLKTVGDPNIPLANARSGGAGKLDTYNRDQAEQTGDMPTINFGPTYSYKPNSRPGTSGTMTPEDVARRSRSQSADRLRQASGSRLGGNFATPSPGESIRHSYFGGRSTPTGVDTAESPSNRHSIAWSPSPGPSGMPPNSAQKRMTLSPEEWVQHRASKAAQIQAPHRRSPGSLSMHHHNASTGNISQMRQTLTKTPPPFVRASSGDWSGQRRTTPPSRPHSRGASVHLATSGGTTSGTLSAREQMTVARVTGSPLINIASSGKKEDDQAPGLVGALAARQREKAAMAQRIRSGLVQNAIAARQQQQMQIEAEAQAQAQAQPQAQPQAQAQAQFEMQQRAQQAQVQQYQQMAYQQAMMNQQAAMAYQQQQQVMNPQMHTTQGYNTAPPSTQAGGFGGQYVQQQGMMTPSQQSAYQRNLFIAQQGQQWQQPRR